MWLTLAVLAGRARRALLIVWPLAQHVLAHAGDGARHLLRGARIVESTDDRTGTALLAASIALNCSAHHDPEDTARLEEQIQAQAPLRAVGDRRRRVAAGGARAIATERARCSRVQKLAPDLTSVPARHAAVRVPRGRRGRARSLEKVVRSGAIVELAGAAAWPLASVDSACSASPRRRAATPFCGAGCSRRIAAARSRSSSAR